MDILCESVFSQGDRERIISIMLAIWDSRNKWAHEEKGYDPARSIEGIAETMSYLESKEVAKEKVCRPPCLWKGPDPGVIKMNSDGSIKEDDVGIAGSGGVARDHRGFRSAWCRSYPGILDPLIIEALAFRDAVVVATQQGYERIICESDYEVLVRMWKGRATHRSVLAPIFSEVDELLGFFQSFMFCFTRQTANKVAHECARFACDHGAEELWLDASPSFLDRLYKLGCELIKCVVALNFLFFVLASLRLKIILQGVK